MCSRPGPQRTTPVRQSRNAQKDDYGTRRLAVSKTSERPGKNMLTILSRANTYDNPRNHGSPEFPTGDRTTVALVSFVPWRFLTSWTAMNLWHRGHAEVRAPSGRSGWCAPQPWCGPARSDEGSPNCA